MPSHSPNRDRIARSARSATTRTTIALTSRRACSARGTSFGRSGSCWALWRPSDCWEWGGATGNGPHGCCGHCFAGGILASWGCPRSSGFAPSSSSCLLSVSDYRLNHSHRSADRLIACSPRVSVRSSGDAHHRGVPAAATGRGNAVARLALRPNGPKILH